MKKANKYDPPKETVGDHAHTLTRAGLGSIPLVGAAAQELFQKLITPPLEKRRQKWIECIAEGLRHLESQQLLSIEQLSENDAFIDAVMFASQAAIKTSQEEKREALKNAVLNSALPDPPDDSRQQIFIGLVESLTVWHLKILRFFSDPAKAFAEQAKTPPQYSIGGSLSQLLTAAYPELANERELYDLIGKDLYGNGLMGTDGFHGMMTGSGVYNKRTTSLGDQFLAFISQPKKQ
jgi:hypothetical protein